MATAATSAATRSNFRKPLLGKGHPLLWVAAFILTNVAITAAVVAGIAQFAPGVSLPYAIKAATDYLGPGGRLTLISIVAVAALSARRLSSPKEASTPSSTSSSTTRSRGWVRGSRRGIDVERGNRPKISDLSESGLDKFRREIERSLSLDNENDYIQLAEGYLSVDCLDKACKAIDHILDFQSKEALLEKVANAYLEKGEKEQAVRVIQKVWINEQIKNTFLVKVAESYYYSDDLKNALRTINKVSLDDQQKDAFRIKIANAYIDRREREKAIEIIDKIVGASPKKFEVLIKIAQSFYFEDKRIEVIRLIATAVCEFLTEEMIQSGKHEIFLQTLRKNFYTTKVNEFIVEIALDCFDETKGYFAQGDTQAILQKIRQKSTSQETIRAFLNLKTQQSHKTNNSRPSPKTRNYHPPTSPYVQYHRILGLEPPASKKQVQDAFKKLAMRCHPDRVKNKTESEKKASEERFKSIVNARDELLKLHT